MDADVSQLRTDSTERARLARLKQELSREVRRAMHRKGLSQSDLAQRMRISSRSTLSRLFGSGLASMQLRTLVRLVLALEGKITLRI